MLDLKLSWLGLSSNSCAALGFVFPRMAALFQLNLSGNSIDEYCVESLIHGLVQCNRLQLLNLNNNTIGDNGLDMLIQGLPASVNTLKLDDNQVALARQLPLTRFESLHLSFNSLCHGGPGIIAESLANPSCRLRELYLCDANIRDEGMTTLAGSLRGNRGLTCMALSNNDITDGWNAFTSVLCDSTSIDATRDSNHTLYYMGSCSRNWDIPSDVREILQFNYGRDKSRVAALKILETNRHLDMRPFLDKKLGLLPHVVAWLDLFAESRLDLKLSSIFEFVRAMPMDVVCGAARSKQREIPVPA